MRCNMTEFQMDTIKLKECGKDIINLTRELNEALTMLFTRINNMPILTGEWVGNSANQFVTILNIEKKDYIALKDNLAEYGKLLLTASEKLEVCIKDNERLQ